MLLTSEKARIWYRGSDSVCGRSLGVLSGPVGFMVFVVSCPGAPEGSNDSDSGFKASQKKGQRLKVSSVRLGEPRIELRTAGYKAGDLSTTPRRLTGTGEVMAVAALKTLLMSHKLCYCNDLLTFKKTSLVFKNWLQDLSAFAKCVGFFKFSLFCKKKKSATPKIMIHYHPGSGSDRTVASERQVTTLRCCTLEDQSLALNRKHRVHKYVNTAATGKFIMI